MSKAGLYAIVRSALDSELILSYPLRVIRETPDTIIVSRVDMPSVPEKEVKKKDVLGFAGSLIELEELNKKNEDIKKLTTQVVALKKDLLKEILKVTDLSN